MIAIALSSVENRPLNCMQQPNCCLFSHVTVVKPCMSPVSSPVSTLEILDGLGELPHLWSVQTRNFLCQRSKTGVSGLITIPA